MSYDPYLHRFMTTGNQGYRADPCTSPYSVITSLPICSLGTKIMFPVAGPVHLASPAQYPHFPYGCSLATGGTEITFNPVHPDSTVPGNWNTVCVNTSPGPGYFMQSPGSAAVYYVDETGTEKYPANGTACDGPGSLCADIPYNVCDDATMLPQDINTLMPEPEPFACQMACAGGIIPAPAPICNTSPPPPPPTRYACNPPPHSGQCHVSPGGNFTNQTECEKATPCAPTPSPASGGSSNVGIIILIVAIVLVLLIGIGIWYYVKHKPSKNNIKAKEPSTIEA